MTEHVAPNITARPHREWLAYLDGWRGLSVLAVLAAHFYPISPINTGRLGVETFFCLSGRLMAGILFVEHYSLRKFIFRRVSRVWPALYVFVIVVATVFSAAGPDQVLPIDIIGGLTFTANYTGIMIHRSAVFDHLWSLSVEEWAYVLLALIAFLTRRWNVPALPILVGLAVVCVVNGVVQTIFGGDYYAVYWRTDVRLASILIPCATFLILRGRSVAPWIPIAAGVLGVALNINRVPDPIKYTVGTMLLSVAIATIDISPAGIRRLMSFYPLRMVGLWSFSLYLWQQPFAKVGGSPTIKLLLVFVIAVASYYVIENPARKWLNRRIERRPVH